MGLCTTSGCVCTRRVPRCWLLPKPCVLSQVADLAFGSSSRFLFSAGEDGKILKTHVLRDGDADIDLLPQLEPELSRSPSVVNARLSGWQVRSIAITDGAKLVAVSTLDTGVHVAWQNVRQKLDYVSEVRGAHSVASWVPVSLLFCYRYAHFNPRRTVLTLQSMEGTAPSTKRRTCTISSLLARRRRIGRHATVSRGSLRRASRFRPTVRGLR